MYTLVGGVVVLALAGGGWLFMKPAVGEEQDAVCLLLVDRTGSSVSERTQASYVDAARDTIEGCRQHRAAMVVYYFDNQNAKVQQASDDQPFSLFRPATRRTKLGEEQVAATQEAALEAVESVFATDPAASRGGHKSDIITAVSLASQSLQQQANLAEVDEKYLVVLTDGYQTGGELAMKRAFTGAKSDVKSLLNETERLGLVPQLDQASVSFVGVGGGVASDKSDVPAWYEAEVRAFWTGLVARGGGDMCIYNVESDTLPGVC